MKRVDYKRYIGKTVDILESGAFLTVKSKEKINTMTIGWGTIGFIWGKAVFLVMVRKSRYTYELINNSKDFTVSIPDSDNLKKELSFCGSKSGRDYDKFKECSLTPLKAQKVNSPIIKDCSLHFECITQYKQKMDNSNLTNSLHDKWYSDEDLHTMYFGEIVDCYLLE